MFTFVGIVKSVADVETFVHPIFSDSGGDLFVQQVAENKIERWLRFDPDSTVEPVLSKISVKAGDEPLVAFETSAGIVAVGSATALAAKLRSDTQLMSRLRREAMFTCAAVIRFIASVDCHAGWPPGGHLTTYYLQESQGVYIEGPLHREAGMSDELSSPAQGESSPRPDGTPMSPGRPIPKGMQRIIDSCTAGLGAIGVVGGAIGPGADLVVIVPTWVGMVVALAEEAGEAMDHETAKKISVAVATGTFALLGGAKVAATALGWVGALFTGGVSLAFSMGANAALNAAVTRAYGRAVATYFLQTDRSDNIDDIVTKLTRSTASNLGLPISGGKDFVK